MTEGPLRLSGILQGLAEREMQVEAIVGADVRAFERRRHRRDVALPQLDGLQIGQAPPYFTQPRRDFEAAAIGGDAVLLPANRLQHMAVAHPHLRLAGKAGERSEE